MVYTKSVKVSVELLLKVGLAVVFLYAAVAAFFDPGSWIGYFPSFLREILPGHLVLNLFSIYEISLALWLIWGRWLFWSGLLSALSLLGIVVFNLSQMDVIFRDLGLIFMALALMVQSKLKSSKLSLAGQNKV